MKRYMGAIAALSLFAGATAVSAQTTTVEHKESGDRSKTVIKHANGAKTVVKRHGANVKKVHKSPTGEKTVVEKKVE